jgi:hypothetical protein
MFSSSNVVEKEFVTIDLGDKRLDKRLHKICEAFSRNPKAILSHAMNTYHDCKAAYRFFENPRVTAEKILKSHHNAITERITENDEVILEIQDSSTLNFTTHEKTDGLGTIRGKNSILKGLELHIALLTTEAGLPLGIGSIKIWSRKEKRALSKGTLYRKVAWEDKESFKWYRATKEVDQIDFKGKTRIFVADREADFYDLHNSFKKDNRLQAIRLKNNRAIKESEEKIRENVDQKERVGSVEIEIKGRGGPQAREKKSIIIEIKFAEVAMKCQTPLGQEDQLPLTVIQAKEIIGEDKKSNDDPIEWHILTNVGVKTFEDAIRVVNWYTKRWQIEDYFKLFKGAMKIEESRLDSAHKLEKLITLLAIVCYRLFWVSRINRIDSEVAATNFFSKLEIFLIARSSKKTSQELMTVGEMVDGIAGLAGYWGRKSDGPPGALRLWRGWTQLMIMVTAAEICQGVVL